MTATGENEKIEKRALAIGKWANLLMGVAGILAAWLSRSDAMLVDGLYSAINFFSAIVAARVSERIGRPPDRRRPWGYDFEETIYVTFRSLLLVGVLLFALFVSGTKILTYATGGDVPDLVFGPIAVYAVAMVVICVGLAISYRWAYVKTGRQSGILNTEARASLVDGAISAGSGAALLSLPFLTGTPLEPLIPIGDAVVVIILVLVIVWQPLSLFRASIGELAAISAPGKTVGVVIRTAKDLCKEYGYSFLRAAVIRAGRGHFVVVYVDPKKPVDAAAVDDYWKKLGGRLRDRIGPVRLEVVITEIADIDPPVS